LLVITDYLAGGKESKDQPNSKISI